METYVYPDAMTEEVIRQKYSSQQIATERVETKNIFVRIWTAVTRFFGYG